MEIIKLCAKNIIIFSVVNVVVNKIKLVIFEVAKYSNILSYLQ